MPSGAKAKQLGLFSLYGLSFVWSSMFGTSEALLFPALSAYPDELLFSRICNLAAFGVVMGALSIAGEKLREIRRGNILMAALILLGAAGMLVGALTGIGVLAAPWLLAGAIMRGLFYGVLTVYWIDVFVRLDDKTIGAAISACLLAYAIAGVVIRGAASVSPVLATLLLVACPIASCVGCARSHDLASIHVPVDQGKTQAPMRTRYLLYIANFAFGIMLGALLHYFAFYDTTPALLAFLGMTAVLFIVFVAGNNGAEASFVYRAFMMCFAVAISVVLLLGFLGQTIAVLAASAALAFLILYTVIIFTDTQARMRTPYWRVPGMCQVFAVVGMISASFLFQAAFPQGQISETQLVLLAGVCIIFVAGVFSPSNRTRQRPWGFSSLIPAESPEARALRRCGELAEECGLTSRELEVLQQLAAGMAKDQIAEALYISPTTAKTHIRNIYAKLGVHSQRELAARLE